MKKPNKKDYKIACNALIVAMIFSTVIGLIDRVLPNRKGGNVHV